MLDHIFLSVSDVDRSVAFYATTLAHSARLHYDPRYCAANAFDPDGTSLEFVYKSWQHA
jgi:catechol 2,3-dioxygenase-like lactoylglutathione lyase family enzyme